MNIASLVEIKANPNIPDIVPGDTVRVGVRIVEGERQRVQVFQGVVIGVRRGGAGASFTVRHVFHGVGVERTFPFNSPLVEKVEIVRHGKVRRAKLYYLRGLSGKAARRKVKRIDAAVRKEVVAEETPEGMPEEAAAATAEAAPIEAAAAEAPEATAAEPEATLVEEVKAEAAPVEEKPAAT